MAGQADELCADAPMVAPPPTVRTPPRRLVTIIASRTYCAAHVAVVVVLCVCGKPPIASRGIGEEPIIFDEGALLLRLQAMKHVKARIALVSNSNVSS